MNIKKLVRPNILALTPYSSARKEFKGKEGIFLDANENPYGDLNRYPDAYQKDIKNKLARLKNVDSNNIFLGNGSDEVIDLAFRIFCNPKDKVITFTPTYGMYDVSAAINDVEVLKIPLDQHFQIDIDKVEKYLDDKSVKILFICSPNNPTGNLMREENIQFILDKFKGIVILDEAYIDFAHQDSLVKWINHYDNLIISQTFSKAWGLAAVRVGVAYANPEIIEFYNNVKPPYNISQINQEAVLNALENTKTFEDNLNKILAEKKRLEKALEEIPLIKKIYYSAANFLLVEVDDANLVYQRLISQKIIIRNRHSQVPNTLRISIGTPAENDALIKGLLAING